jgi:hypothetical protein
VAEKLYRAKASPGSNYMLKEKLESASEGPETVCLLLFLEVFQMQKKKKFNVVNGSKEFYEGKVIAEARNRAGNNPHLKGHIHEILIKDKLNSNPSSILQGKKAVLTKNSNARSADIVVKKAGKIVQRIQAKDTVSNGGISKTVSQIKNGQYRNSKILTTEETTTKLSQALKNKDISKQVQSSGIKTETTTRLAVKAGAGAGKNIGNAVKNSFTSGAVSSAAKAGGAYGALTVAGISAVDGIIDLVNGDRDFEEVAVDVAKNTVKGGLSGAAAAGAATVAGTAVTAGAATIGLTGAAATVAIVATPVAAAIIIGGLVCSLFDSIFG